MKYRNLKSLTLSTPILLIIGVALSGLIFVFDLSLPLGVAGGIPYVAIILIGIWLPKWWYTVGLAVLASLLTILGYIFSEPGSIPWVVLTNRALSLFVIWIVTILLLMRKRTEVELNLTSQRLVQGAKLASLGTWDWDLTKNITTWDDKLFEFYGLPKEVPMPYEKWARTVHPDDLPLVEIWIKQIIENKTKETCEFRIYRPDNSIRCISAAGIPIVDSNNQVARVVGYNMDITEQKEAEVLLQAKLIAEEANKTKSLFLTRMSHELRTPLNSILGFAQLLEAEQGEIKPERQKNHVEQILNSGWHLLDLVEDVLDLASIEANKIELSIGAVNTAAIIQECVDTMLPLALERDITIEYTADVHCKGCSVMADALRLKQVLLNFLSNAIKYNRRSGRVSVTCQQTDAGRGRIMVTDTGSGIPEEDQVHLFEPFSQLYLKTYAVQGTGIGLSISKHLVERMGGSIGIESQPGKGSTFWVELDLAQQTASDIEVKGPAVPDASDEVDAEQHYTLLYVEDSPSHIQLVQAIVDRISDISLLTANTPQLGLELAAAHSPDLIILDICLPGMDGFEVLEKLQENKALCYTPVIAVSANAMPQEIEKGLRAGFRRYLTKPINVKEFKKAVIELLNDRVI